MKFLIDTSPEQLTELLASSQIVSGQLITPLTRYANARGVWALDNGAFSGFREEAFRRLLKRDLEHAPKCLFVAVPDVVGSARRTLELFDSLGTELPAFDRRWKLALVAQDGIENLEIPWPQIKAIFIGGTNRFKDSSDAIHVVRAAKVLGKHVHVGRVNTAPRFLRYRTAGADTCDGSGVAKFDHMLPAIERAILEAEAQKELFTPEQDGAVQ